MARDSFIFYRSFYEAIREIPEENQLDVYNAIINYGLNQEEIELKGVSKAIFSLVKPNIEAATKRYDAQIENGKKGGAPKGNNNAKKQPKNNPKTTQEQPKNNLNYNKDYNEDDNDNYNDNHNKVSDSCVDGLQDVIEFFNNNVGQLTPYGLKLIDSYVEEMGKDVVIYAMQISVEADKRSIQYIKAILNNWSKKGIKTLVEAQKESERKPKKADTQEFNQSNNEWEDLYDN